MTSIKNNTCYIKIADKMVLPSLTMISAIQEIETERSYFYLYDDLEEARADFRALMIALVVEEDFTFDSFMAYGKDLLIFDSNRIELINENFL